MADTTMKAVRIHSYGGPETLVYEDAPIPAIAADELLVRVHATSVNPVDWKAREGYLHGAFPYPFPIILGWDVSGIVEAVGADVTEFHIGDAVYSCPGLTHPGSYAEYVAVPAATAALKPQSLDHVEAGAVPLAAMTAWQALFDAAGLESGQTVLIHAAAGGVGTFAVQFAKWKGARVIATASPRNTDFLRELGVDEVVDYNTVRFEDVVRDADVVLDGVGGETLERSFAVLKPGGFLASIVAQPAPEKATAHGVRAANVFMQPSAANLRQIADLIDLGRVEPVISAVLPLTETRQAHEVSQDGHVRARSFSPLNINRNRYNQAMNTLTMASEREAVDLSLDLETEIVRLKKDMNAVILAHYYQEGEIQDLADHVGDSLALAQAAAKTDADVIVFCGVHFMAETAKILNPEKLVLLPDLDAGCSLADRCPADEYAEWLKQYPGHTVINYVNSSAGVKALSDIIVTSSNAVDIVKQLPSDQPIVFGPDRHLGKWVESQTGRKMVLWPGFCIVHEQFNARRLAKMRAEYPNAALIAHPECEEAVLAQADYIGSTLALLKYVQTHTERKQFIVATEHGILHQMEKSRPDAEFLCSPPNSGCNCAMCPYMRLNTLEKLYLCLRDQRPEITMDEDIRVRALRPVLRMLDMSKNLSPVQQKGD